MHDVTTAPISLRERNRQRTRLLLLESAASLFSEQGFTETTIDDIANLAGSSRATIYAYFATKDDILVALSDEMFARTEDMYRDFARLSDYSPECIRTWLDDVVTPAWEANLPRTKAVSRHYVWPEGEVAAAHDSFIAAVVGEDARWARYTSDEARARLFILMGTVETYYTLTFVENWDSPDDIALTRLAETCSFITGFPPAPQ